LFNSSFHPPPHSFADGNTKPPVTLFRQARLDYDAIWASSSCPYTESTVACVATAQMKFRSDTLCRSLFIHKTSNGGCHHHVQYVSTQACALAKSITRGSRMSLLAAQLLCCGSASKRSCRPARAQCKSAARHSQCRFWFLIYCAVARSSKRTCKDCSNYEPFITVMAGLPTCDISEIV